MHQTAMLNCQRFFDAYGKSFAGHGNVKIIEIGSQDINGTLRDVCPKQFDYIGVDFVAGNGVDVVLDDPYALPFEAEVADVVLSSSCFEHAEMFWLTFLEILRILKPNGLFYLNAPSNGMFHRHPVDCWRFYPDSGEALVSWAKRNGINAVLLESFISNQLNNGALWNDFIAVFLKDKDSIDQHNDRIIRHTEDFSNGRSYGVDGIINYSEQTDDHKKLHLISQIISNKIKIR